MDASAYLKRQGWRGDGHSLDQSNRGIRKPLLVSKKVDALGVGLNKHKAVSDQWWLRAFDQGLKSLGTGEESVLANVQKHGVNRGGLYGRFVKGERFAGSIDQTPQSSEGDSPSGASTPAEQIKETRSNKAVDVPPVGKLESLVGAQSDKNSHEAGTKNMLGKRKRSEQPGEKRAHRKVVRHERTNQGGQEHRHCGIEEGTWDAQRSLDEVRNGTVPVGTATDASVFLCNQSDDKIHRLSDRFASNKQVNENNSSKSSRKADKYLREKTKRAAKANLMSEKLSHEQNHEEREAKKTEKKMRAAQKRADAAKKEAERLAKREKAAAQKKERRMRRQSGSEKTDKSIEEPVAAPNANKREAAVNDGGRMDDNEFRTRADLVKFGTNPKGGKKKISEVGSVESHPTKAEKTAKELDAEEAKIDPYRNTTHDMTLEEHRAAFQRGDGHKSDVEMRNVAPNKLAEYKQRATEKGIKLEDYIRRRDEKSRTKKVEKLRNPPRQNNADIVRNGIEYTAPLPQQRSVLAPSSASAGTSTASGLSFIIDTEGDPALTRASSQNQARAAIRKNKPARNH